MHPTPIRRPSPVRAAVAAALLAMALGATAAHAQATDSQATRATHDTGYALVQLNGEPLASYVRTKPAKGKKVDFASNTTKSYRAQLSAQRNDYKAWLRANVPQAKVTGEFDVSLNAVAVKLNGASLAQVSATPLVKTAQYQGLYYRNIADPDLALIEAETAWAQGGGPATAGLGVKIAIVDSGIDHTHPCFSDADYPAQPKLGDPRFTNNKVIAAKVFNNRLHQSGFTAEAVDSHGTHVAGTAACNYQTSGVPNVVNGVVLPYKMSGVAPRALLGNYNVFPGNVESARSEDIVNALDAAYEDGFDVANMSLGGVSHGRQDLLTIAVDNLDQANMIVAIANGNSGPGAFTVDSPGNAARALSAGASSVPHFVGAPVTVGGTTFGAASGEFAVVAADLTAPLGVVVGPAPVGIGVACTALPAGSLSGQIALISRGTCTFSAKIRNAQSAGAVAVLVANNVAGDPTAMASDGTPNQPTIPAYMVSRDDGQVLKTKGGQNTTIGSALSYFLTNNANIMAGFSSQGPTDVDFRVKPDVVAPGVNVLSSVPANACEEPPCFAFFSGTSMASPHLAGSAAVVLSQHPAWSAAEVRSAVVNTAARGVLRDFTNALPVSNVNIVGSGLENLLNAVNATVALDPVSVSFGAVPSGRGSINQLSMQLTNLSGAAKTFGLAIGAQPAGLTYSVNPSTVTLAAGASTSVTVTMSAPKGAAAGHKQAYLDISVGGVEVAHAALYTLIK